MMLNRLKDIFNFFCNELLLLLFTIKQSLIFFFYLFINLILNICVFCIRLILIICVIVVLIHASVALIFQMDIYYAIFILILVGLYQIMLYLFYVCGLVNYVHNLNIFVKLLIIFIFVFNVGLVIHVLINFLNPDIIKYIYDYYIVVYPLGVILMYIVIFNLILDYKLKYISLVFKTPKNISNFVVHLYILLIICILIILFLFFIYAHGYLSNLLYFLINYVDHIFGMIGLLFVDILLNTYYKGIFKYLKKYKCFYLLTFIFFIILLLFVYFFDFRIFVILFMYPFNLIFYMFIIFFYIRYLMYLILKNTFIYTDCFFNNCTFDNDTSEEGFLEMTIRIKFGFYYFVLLTISLFGLLLMISFT